MSDERDLNSQQLKAVSHGSGPLLIIAGAGTGKTTVITERVKHLITSGLATPGEILALTFTEKAAREMETRIDVALPYGYTQMWVMTFHSFCDRVLRDDGLHIGLSTDYKLLSDTESTSLLRGHLFDWDLKYFRPLGNPTKFISGLLQHFSRLADEDITPQDYLNWASEDPSPELARLYRDYSNLKVKEGFLDFSDLISHTLRLFRDRPTILESYQQKFKYILVDEFQDTNYAQNQLLNLLAGHRKNLTVVGDGNQSIYRFRGAAFSNIIQFKELYPEAVQVTLTHNYRSTQEILNRAYDLIQHNNPDPNPKLISTRELKGEPIEFLHADRVENEADLVIQKIKSLKVDPKDVAILVRANAHAEPFTRSLARHGLPYQFLGPGQLFHQPEIKDLIAYLRVLANFEDNASFYRVLAMDFFALPPRDLAVITNHARKHNLSFFEVCESSLLPSVKPIVDLIHKHLALLPTTTAGQILYDFLESSGMLRSILDYKLPIDEKRATNIMKFFNKLKSYEANHPDAFVPMVVDWLDLCLELGESPLAADTDWTENNAVNILTLHSAKGLEFPVVFLVNLVSQRFPSTERREQIPIPEALIKEVLPPGDFHLQEERRLFYVGMTRARDRLFLTAADYYGEAKREKKLSPFISEALGQDPLTLSSSSTLQLSILDFQKPPQSLSIKNSALSINYLSYSQIQTFLDCPLHYKAKYILHIPTSPSAALTFGTAIHATLKDFLTDPAQNILDILKKHWSSVGFSSKKHEQEYLAKGRNILNHFAASGFDPHNLPKVLEQNFTIPLTPTLKIGGKIDRVDVHPDGTLEIIDYKTGAIPKDREKTIADDLQLSFYALAATTLKDFPFGNPSAQIKLTLHYLEDQQKFTTTRTPDQLATAKQEILDYADAISKSDFHCSGNIFCKTCEYQILCDMTTS